MALPPLLDTPAGLDPAHVTAAAALVRAYCGWHVAPVIGDELVLDGGGVRRLILPTLRVVELVELKVDDVVVPSPEWSTRGVIRGRFPDRLACVQVHMRHGYDEAPAEVAALVTSLARSAAADTPLGIRSKTLGDYSVTYSSESLAGGSTLTAAHRTVLDHYRLPVLP